jgi:hypothetical protein
MAIRLPYPMTADVMTHWFVLDRKNLTETAMEE